MRATLLLVLLSLAAPALAQDDDIIFSQGRRHSAPLVPWYVPRGAFVGTYVKRGVTPQLRVQWQVNVARMRNDALLLVLEGGGGYGLSHPAPLETDLTADMTLFYEHTAMFGLGYRALYENGIAWGFQLLAGPVFYGARYEGLPTENELYGLVEGRMQLGMKVGKTTMGVSLGIGTLFEERVRGETWRHVGGLLGGLFVEWR